MHLFMADLVSLLSGAMYFSYSACRDSRKFKSNVGQFLFTIRWIGFGFRHSARLVFRDGRDDFVLARLGGELDPVVACVAP